MARTPLEPVGSDHLGNLHIWHLGILTVPDTRSDLSALLSPFVTGGGTPSRAQEWALV